MAVFEMMDIRSISFYLGLKIRQEREKKTIKVAQPAYIDKILAKFHLFQANMSNTSMKEALLEPDKEKVTAAERECYQEMIGSIIFSIVETRVDIAFATYLSVDLQRIFPICRTKS